MYNLLFNLHLPNKILQQIIKLSKIKHNKFVSFSHYVYINLIVHEFLVLCLDFF